HCDFQDLESRLIDQLQFGLSNLSIKRNVLADSSTTFKSKVKAALVAEATLESAKKLLPPNSDAGNANQLMTSPSGDVHAMQKRRAVNSTKKRYGEGIDVHSSSYACMRCGGKGHFLADCVAKKAQCRSCNKKGHYSRVC